MFESRQNTDPIRIIPRAYKCPSCGASLTIEPDHISTFCSFCGSLLPKAEAIIDEINKNQEKQETRAFEIQKMRHEERKNLIANTGIIIRGIVAILGLIIVLIMFLPILKISFR